MQAIISGTENEEFAGIVVSIAGVMFLGTPHRGSTLAPLAVKTAHMASKFGTTEDRLLQLLEPENGYLIEVLRRFSKWLFVESVPVVCVYESSTRGKFISSIKQLFSQLAADRVVLPNNNSDLSLFHETFDNWKSPRRWERHSRFQVLEHIRLNQDSWHAHLWSHYATLEWRHHALASHSAILRDGGKLDTDFDFAKSPKLLQSWLILTIVEDEGDMTQLLLEKYANSAQLPATLWAAIRLRREATFKSLMKIGKKDIDINAEIDGDPPLGLAVKLGYCNMVLLLLDKGANINAESRQKKTPLFAAVEWGRYETAKLLLDKGADFNAKDTLEQTPLFAAAEWGKHIVAKLVVKGAHLYTTGNEGTEVLFAQVERGQYKIVELLVDKGANINATNNKGQTPLFAVVKRRKYKMAKLLVNNGADINATDNKGQTPLLVAVKWRKYELAKLLVYKGADIHATDNKGQTPLSIASAIRWTRMTKLLLKGNVDVNRRNHNGRNTPI
jgi:ankyrin repeat protein